MQSAPGPERTPRFETQPVAPLPLTGLIFNVMRFSLHDGPGIRTTVFLKGCPLRCRWCHNPESQSVKPEVIYFDDRCIACGDCANACPRGALHLNQHVIQNLDLCQRCAKCVQACPVAARQLAGQRKSVRDVVAEVVKDQIFFDESGGGITVSGGEPLMQPAFVKSLLAECKARRIRTALDTCGFADTAVLREINEYVDLFLYDLKLMDSEKHQHFTGVKNDLILQNLKFLATQGSTVIVRIPVIPEVNDDVDNIHTVCDFVYSLGFRKIDLLPYHRIASDKYRRLHLCNHMDGVTPPSTEHMETLAAHVRHAGFSVRVGG